ncbi:hypothetical protein [Arthrobacter sp. KNU40]|uniref:hypothetical protein n=1 Tax=Arthrobacter sp. KNU40 TaxID=3447965 RepID=UPI003F603FC3
MPTVSDPIVPDGAPRPRAERIKCGVLQFGGEFIHCGEPMQISGTGFHSVYAPMSTEDPAVDLLDVYLATKVLQCRCGFRMELPS